MNSDTRSNVSAWARRFGVEITNYERACAVADSVFGGPSRRGAIFVTAMKAVSEKFDLPMGSDVTRCAAAVVSHVVYTISYRDEPGLCATTLARKVVTEHAIGEKDETRRAVQSLQEDLITMALRALTARTAERTSRGPSLVNVILARAQQR